MSFRATATLLDFSRSMRVLRCRMTPLARFAHTLLPRLSTAIGIGLCGHVAHAADEATVPAFKTTPPDLPDAGVEGAADQPVWQVTTDVLRDTVAVTIHDGGEDILEDGRRLYAAETLELMASDSDPEHASLKADVVYRWREHTFETEIRARSRQTSDADAFDLVVELEVDVDGEAFFRRRWHESIPRRLV